MVGCLRAGEAVPGAPASGPLRGPQPQHGGHREGHARLPRPALDLADDGVHQYAHQQGIQLTGTVFVLSRGSYIRW